MDVKSINERKMIGDMKTAALMLGKTSEAIRIIWSRNDNSKSFIKVKEALEKIIASRENLINTNK